MKYIVDDYTEESNDELNEQGFKTNEHDLPINNIDNFYAAGVNRHHTWVANINPLNDQYDARYHAFPSSLMSYTYPSADETGYYRFDFKYLNVTEEENSNYTRPLIGNEKNYSFNNEVLEAYSEAAKNESAVSYPSGVNQEIMSRAAQSHGNWGVRYTYNIDVKNDGKQDKIIELYSVMKNFVGLVYYITDLDTNQIIASDGYTVISDIDTGINDMVRSDVKLINMEIPAKSQYRLTVTFLNGVGDAGFVHHLKLKSV